MRRLIEEMAVRPAHLDVRIMEAFRAEPQEAIRILRGLMLETYDLVDAHTPDIKTTTARDAFLKQRPQFAEMPANIPFSR